MNSSESFCNVILTHSSLCRTSLTSDILLPLPATGHESLDGGTSSRRHRWRRTCGKLYLHVYLRVGPHNHCRDCLLHISSQDLDAGRMSSVSPSVRTGQDGGTATFPEPEQDHKPSMPVYGRACTLWPRTLELLDQLDLLDGLLEQGVISRTGMNFREYVPARPRISDLPSPLTSTPFPPTVEIWHLADWFSVIAWISSAIPCLSSRESSITSSTIKVTFLPILTQYSSSTLR